MYKQNFFQNIKPLTHSEVNENIKKIARENPAAYHNVVNNTKKPLTHEEVNIKIANIKIKKG